MAKDKLDYLKWLSVSVNAESFKGLYVFIDAKDSSATNQFFFEEACSLAEEVLSKSEELEKIEFKQFKSKEKFKSSELLDEIYSPGMFSSQKLIIVSIFEDAVKTITDELLHMIADPPEGVCIMVHLDKLNGNSKLYKSLSSSGRAINFTRMFDAPPSWNTKQAEYDNDYTNWISNRAKRYKKKISLATAMHLLIKAGNNLKTLDNYLNTLSIYDDHSSEIQKNHIDAIVVKPTGLNIFKVIDTIITRDLKSSLLATRKLFKYGMNSDQGGLETKPDLIFTAFFLPNLFRRIKRILDIKYLLSQGYSFKDAALNQGVPPYFANSLESEVQKFSKFAHIHECLKALLDADKRSKTSDDNSMGLAENLVMKICQ